LPHYERAVEFSGSCKKTLNGHLNGRPSKNAVTPIMTAYMVNAQMFTRYSGSIKLYDATRFRSSQYGIVPDVNSDQKLIVPVRGMLRCGGGNPVSFVSSFFFLASQRGRAKVRKQEARCIELQ
jgi:hypothetical protein